MAVLERRIAVVTGKKGREVRALPAVTRPLGMALGGSRTTTEGDSAEVFREHLSSMGGCEQDSTKLEREERELRWAKRGEVLNPPAGISFDGTPHRIFCDGGADPNPGPVGSGITVGKKESYATHNAQGRGL